MNPLISEYGKLPPQAIDLEKAILWGLILEAGYSFPQIIDILKPEHFYRDSNSVLFSVLLEMFTKDKPVDLLTVTEECRAKGILEEIGGAFGITNLLGNITSASNIRYYANVVHEKYMVREYIKYASELVTNGFNDSIDDCINSVNKINSVVSDKKEKKTIKDIISDIDNYEEGQIINTGSASLNRVIGGFNKGNVYTVAGRPAMGKTSLVLGLFHKTLMKYLNGLIWSLEMPSVQMVRWMIQSYGLSKAKVLYRNFTPEERILYDTAKKDILESKFKIIEPMQFEEFLLRVKQEHISGLDYVIIDYIQNINTSTKYQNETAKLEQIMVDLKNIAVKLDIFFIIVSQLNRSVEERTNRTPKPSDLRGSGGIEQSSDVIMFPFRAEEYTRTGDGNIEATYAEIGEPVNGIMKLIIAKNKDGAKENVYLRYSEDVKRFSDYESEIMYNQNF